MIPGAPGTVRPKIGDCRKEVKDEPAAHVRDRTSVIEGILHRIEDRIEEWREQDRTHATATQREKLLAEVVTEEAHEDSVDEVAKPKRRV
jgi:hypothetical protein